MKGDTISRSALIKAFHTDIVNHMQYIDDSTVSVCIAEIEEAPTVAAAPEVHGRWVCVPEECDVGYDTYKCSICNEHFVVDFDFEKPKFCPVCGARMDEGEGE